MNKVKVEDLIEGDIVAINRKRTAGKPRYVVLEVTKPAWMKGENYYRRLNKIPPGCPPWGDSIYSIDEPILVGRNTDKDISEKLRLYGVEYVKD